MAAAPRITEAMVDAAFCKTAEKAVPLECAFRQGDLVVYPAHGVGRVERTGKETLGGYRIEIIDLSFTETRMRVRIPVVALEKSGLRKISSTCELEKALEILRERPRSSRMIWWKRSEQYQLMINSGVLKELASVVRDLQAKPRQGMSYSQHKFYTAAIERMGDEFAAVQGTGKARAVELLEHELYEAAERLPAKTDR